MTITSALRVLSCREPAQPGPHRQRRRQPGRAAQQVDRRPSREVDVAAGRVREPAMEGPVDRQGEGEAGHDGGVGEIGLGV